MDNAIELILTKLWLDRSSLGEQEYKIWKNDLIALAYSAPLAILGVAWLIYNTAWEVFKEKWLLLGMVFGLIYLFRQLDFFAFTEIKTGLYADWGNSLDIIASWSAALLLGPVALWPGFVLFLIHYFIKFKDHSSTRLLFDRTRHLAMDITDQVLLAQVALYLYQKWGGVFPLSGFNLAHLLPAIYATIAWYILSRLFWLYHFIRSFFPAFTSMPKAEHDPALRQIIRLYAITDLTPLFVAPFGLITAVLYIQNGPWIYLFNMFGLVMSSLLANLLSKAAERSYHRSRELDRLERLGTDIIDAPLDASTLPDLLQQHVPGMFPDSQIEIRLFPDTILLPCSDDWPAIPEAMWSWLQNHTQPEVFFYPRGEVWPWDQSPSLSTLLIVPIFSIETGKLIGGIGLTMRWWPPRIAPLFIPALQSLAAQISSALHQADVYIRTLAHERVMQELSLAGEIQANLLPNQNPNITGWRFASVLEATRETSGDFYDFIPLPKGKLGLVVADVADKGMGAALFMTLSRTLIRTYAYEHPSRPDRVLKDVNQRILDETGADLFVTVFYGILEPETGQLDYCNAGQLPPFWKKRDSNLPLQRLSRTGMALGVLADAPWNLATIMLNPGDLVILYTDGITDAQNSEDQYYSLNSLHEVIQNSAPVSAEEMQTMILNRVHQFAGDKPIEDDITLMVVERC